MLYRIFFICILWCCCIKAVAQPRNIGNNANIRYDNQGRPMRAAKQDSLQKRDVQADSITIFYKSLGGVTLNSLDSSISDFTTRFPVPYHYNHLGNYGAAAKNLLFAPLMKAGWDAGFHQFDNYLYNIANTRFYQTTRPYTEMAYLLGSRAEQLVNITHTQNRHSRFNIGLEYRFSNMPGVLRTQNVSHNNIRITAHYQSKKRRYESYTVFISNKQAASENGGVVSPGRLDSLALGDPYEVETRLGSPFAFSRNPFNTVVKTGNTYKQSHLLYQHQYDFGQKDSIVNDSSVIYLFYPRFRLQHVLQLQTQTYLFSDVDADSAGYRNYFNYQLNKNRDSVRFQDKWQIFTNEFFLISFPQKNNQSQFLKTGIGFQTIQGNFGLINPTTNSYYNIFAKGEYRNLTRNKVWDLWLRGELYINGLNSGDYDIMGSIQRTLKNNQQLLQIGLHNVNRSPSFIYQQESNFPLKTATNWAKENISRLFAVYKNNQHQLTASANYFLVANYLYFDSFFTAKQEGTLFNVIQLNLEKKWKIAKHWYWYSELNLQKATGNAPVNLPLVVTRQRFAFEGKFYTNLQVSTGLELRYISNFNADGYSPFMGQFFYQNSFQQNNRPEVHAYFHFMIKNFKGFVRLENLHTINFKTGAFNRYNYAAQFYPQQGQWFRLGIWWTFIN
ncbi:MAG: putative porin, partial [Chitinophagaceae bacterium]